MIFIFFCSLIVLKGSIVYKYMIINNNNNKEMRIHKISARISYHWVSEKSLKDKKADVHILL